MNHRSTLHSAVAIAATLGLSLVVAGEASAHIEITTHTTRNGASTQKISPCGAADDTGPAGNPNIYTYAPGTTVTLGWNEFVDHPGHYRVAFDSSGTDAFVDPASADDLFNSPTVVLDGIPDEAGVHDYEVELQLPDEECESCTIQILQIMTDKPPFADGNDIYYHCIDVRLVAGGGDGDGDPSTGDGDGDPTTGDGDGDGDPSTGDGDGDPSTGDGDGDPSTGGTEGGEAGNDDDARGGCSTTSRGLGPVGGLALLSLLLIRRRRDRDADPRRVR